MRVFVFVLLTITLGLLALLVLFHAITLYFNHLHFVNGMHIFRLWDEHEDERVHDLLQYLAYWLGIVTFILFDVLLLLTFFADEQLQLYTLAAVIVMGVLFYWRMYPLIRKMDKDGLIRPFGHSKVIGRRIGELLFILSTIIVSYFIFHV